MKLYDKKNGKEFNIPHTVDVKEWLETGKYTKVNPKSKPKKETPKPTIEMT